MRCPNCNELLIVNPTNGKCRRATRPISEDYDGYENAIYTTYICDSCNTKFRTKEEVIEKKYSLT